MTSDKIPSRTVMPCPFGGFGNDNIVQIGSVSGTDMNYPDGFPSAYGAPTENNGKFVLRKEMNALGKAATNDLFYHKCGGLNTFDADFCAAVGGYPKGAVLQMVDGYSIRSVMSLVDNNKVCFTGQTLTDAQKNAGLTNADVDSISWIYLNESMSESNILSVEFNVATWHSIIASFIPSRSGTARFVVDAEAETKTIDYEGTGSAFKPSLYSYASTGFLMSEYSNSLKLPSISGSASSYGISWATWGLVYGNVLGSTGYYDGKEVIPANRYPPISSYSVEMGKKYIILAVAGQSITNTNPITVSTTSYKGKISVFLA